MTTQAQTAAETRLLAVLLEMTIEGGEAMGNEGFDPFRDEAYLAAVAVLEEYGMVQVEIDFVHKNVVHLKLKRIDTGVAP